MAPFTFCWRASEASLARGSFNAIVTGKHFDVTEAMIRHTSMGRQAELGPAWTPAGLKERKIALLLTQEAPQEAEDSTEDCSNPPMCTYTGEAKDTSQDCSNPQIRPCDVPDPSLALTSARHRPSGDGTLPSISQAGSKHCARDRPQSSFRVSFDDCPVSFDDLPSARLDVPSKFQNQSRENDADFFNQSRETHGDFFNQSRETDEDFFNQSQEDYDNRTVWICPPGETTVSWNKVESSLSRESYNNIIQKNLKLGPQSVLSEKFDVSEAMIRRTCMSRQAQLGPQWTPSGLLCRRIANSNMSGVPLRDYSEPCQNATRYDARYYPCGMATTPLDTPRGRARLGASEMIPRPPSSGEAPGHHGRARRNLRALGIVN